MQTKPLYINISPEGVTSEGPEKFDDTWILSDTIRILAEPGYILFYNGACYGSDVADVKSTDGWTEQLMTY